MITLRLLVSSKFHGSHGPARNILVFAWSSTVFAKSGIRGCATVVGTPCEVYADLDSDLPE